MRILSPAVPRAVIDDEIGAARYPGHSPARWALPLVAALDDEARGWQRVALAPDEFAALWLPPHAGEPCHGDTMALGTTTDGGTLATLGDWLDAHADAYAAANPSCWGRIEAARQEPPSCLVVAGWSVGDRVKPDHAALVVVDGLHRALGAWRRGDRTCEAYLPR
ncbi:hypothetical protein TBR22_A50750 [Luteitalea sp. TBR-22]|uniref:DUF6309 family protein n=1 Tax=Luteitalea sp. TBR-22 TaxID=2802971 RepID=UPI001AFA254E|nr:DUF6309 family protein [Luteitalea sp. TBR-22]BCS35841.1 hypothetical protein TBR22_A50750 [Luteitalea sp. TBR-22]